MNLSLMAFVALAGGLPWALGAAESLVQTRELARQWRAELRLVDMHQHINMTTQHVTRAVSLMDAAGIGVAVNLGTGTVTPAPDGGPSAFERGRQLTEARFPGRILHYMVLDYAGWDEPDFSARAVRQVETGFRLGAAGLKEFKRLGLGLRDGQGRLIRVDDPKLDPVWKRCGELNLPVSIHVADPKAFWAPFDETNERWKELKDHKNWWFGEPNKFPPWKDLLEALNRVIARHPQTTFVCVHFANNAEELDWVEQSLDRHPNLMADVAARIPELGRHPPEALRRLFLKHQDRILFGTDFMVYNRLILGSSGNEPPPDDAAAQVFFAKHWRWFETLDRDWEHMTPIQGDWTISAIGLPAPVLRKIYFDNARRLLARSLPLPTLRAKRITRDFTPDGRLNDAVWQTAPPARLEYTLMRAEARPELSTTVRCLWSPTALYFAFECPFTRLTVFEPAQKQERLGLWDKDVVEVFLGTDPAMPNRYYEFEVAPNGEKLDVDIRLPEKNFAWDSGFRAAVRVDAARGVWTAELRIPLAAVSDRPPAPGTRWRLNLYRQDCAANAFLAWSATLANSTHVPRRFGTLELME